jgi:hypothetical protein
VTHVADKNDNGMNDIGLESPGVERKDQIHVRIAPDKI